MSKNFELLQKLGKELDILKPVPVVGERGEVPLAADPTAANPIAIDEPVLEQINALVQQVFLAPGASAPRAVVFASTEPGTGCTWVTAHVAQVLANRVAGTVCVVDANLRNPSLHEQFNLDNQTGISDALVQLDPIRTFARQVNSPNLWLISSGSAAAGAVPLVASDRMRLRITELRSEFDFVLIDSFAMNVANDAISLGTYADGVVLVLKANASRREAALQAKKDLESRNAKVLGAVLNQRKFPIPEKIYNKL